MPAFDTSGVHGVFVEIESETDEMHIGSDARLNGRFVVDIDNCLRLTDSSFLTARDVLALQGCSDPDAFVIWDRQDQHLALGAHDRIELDEACVEFFRIVTGVSALPRANVVGARLPRNQIYDLDIAA